MKTATSLVSLIAASWMGVRYHGVSETKSDSESRLTEVTAQIDELAREISATKIELESLNARLTALGAQPQPASKSNWIEERNSNWKSTLARGAYDNRRVMTSVPQVVVIQTQPTAASSAPLFTRSENAQVFSPPPRIAPPISSVPRERLPQPPSGSFVPRERPPLPRPGSSVPASRPAPPPDLPPPGSPPPGARPPVAPPTGS